MSYWRYAENNGYNEEVVNNLGKSVLAGRLLANRGVYDLEDAKLYFAEKYSELAQYITDFASAKDVEKSFEVLVHSINNKHRITVYGDYDVDGVTSTAILYKTIKFLGGDVDFYIPDRHTEGYGLNIGAVEKLAEKGTKVLLTCDNGIAAVDEIKRAKELGMKVVVIDHHEPKYEIKDDRKIYIIPEADAVIDAKQEECGYKFKNLCAGGMCYYYAEKLCGKMNYDYKAIQGEMLALATIATVCDMVELKGDNRIIVKNGLKVLNSAKRMEKYKGLKALFGKRENSKPISEFTLGFFAGPCINAAGRLESGAKAVKLLITDNEKEAEELADHLIKLNEKRKEMTEEAYINAVEYIKANGYENDNVIIADIENVSQSVAGIAAGRVKERFNKPSIVISAAKDPTTGSARSIEGYNIFDGLLNAEKMHKDLFVKFGGHSQAAGLTIKKDKIGILRKILNDTYDNPDYKEGGIIDIDFDTDFGDFTMKSVEETEAMGPFGMGYEAPVFSSHSVVLKDFRIIGKKNNTMKFVFFDKNGVKMNGISFSGLDKFKEDLKGKLSKKEYDNIFNKNIYEIEIPMDIAFSAAINEFNGYRSIQLEIKDWVINL